MPIYAYKCKDCEHQFDIRQRFSDEPLTGCPRCEGRIRRVIYPVGVVFKGSGFYVTDNRNGSTKGIKNGITKKNDEKSKETSTKSDSSSTAGTTESSSKSSSDSHSK